MAFRLVAYVSFFFVGGESVRAMGQEPTEERAHRVNLHPEAGGGFKCAVGSPDLRGLWRTAATWGSEDNDPLRRTPAVVKQERPAVWPDYQSRREKEPIQSLASRLSAVGAECVCFPSFASLRVARLPLECLPGW